MKFVIIYIQEERNELKLEENSNYNVKGPVWWTDKDKMYSDDARQSEYELSNMKTDLLQELEKPLKA
ncbi:MAG: hypothetical protein GX306_02780 [Clostridiales bacterium]|nr:hypothetical protein [Clostridiales bacterium]